MRAKKKSKYEFAFFNYGVSPYARQSTFLCEFCHYERKMHCEFDLNVLFMGRLSAWQVSANDRLCDLDLSSSGENVLFLLLLFF